MIQDACAKALEMTQSWVDGWFLIGVIREFLRVLVAGQYFRKWMWALGDLWGRGASRKPPESKGQP